MAIEDFMYSAIKNHEYLPTSLCYVVFILSSQTNILTKVTCATLNHINILNDSICGN